MQVQDNLLYTKDHEWVLVEGNQATVGISSYAQKELGDIVYVDIEKIEGSLRLGSVFGTIEAVKTVSDLFMPVSGRILSINSELEPHPELVNSDPYGDGWMIRIEIEKPQELEKLLSAANYQQLIAI